MSLAARLEMLGHESNGTDVTGSITSVTNTAKQPDNGTSKPVVVNGLLPDEDYTSNDSTLDGIIDGVGELIAIDKKLGTESLRSELAIHGIAIRLEHLSRHPYIDFIPNHVIEHPTHESISAAVKSAIEKIIAWIKEHYNKLREHITRGVRKKRAADTTNKVKSILKELDTVEETLKKDTTGTSTKAITIDLSNHYEIQRVLGVLGRYISKLEPCKDDSELITALTKYVAHVSGLVHSNIQTHLLSAIADIAASPSMGEVYNKLADALKNANIYRGGYFSLDDQRYETSIVSINTFITYEADTKFIRYGKIDSSGRFYNIKNNTFTVNDPKSFLERVRVCMKPLGEMDFPGLLDKAADELKIVEGALIKHIVEESSSDKSNEDILRAYKHAILMITRLYENGYISTAIDGVYTLIAATASLFDVLGLTPEDFQQEEE